MKNPGDGLNATFACDAIAYDSRALLVLSAAGPAVAVKALRASLFTGKPTFEYARTEREWPDVYGLTKDTHGYTVSKPMKLGYSTWQIIAVSQRPGLLAAADDEALWQYLVKHHTTPMLRHWMPWLKGELAKEKCYTEPERVGCMSALVSTTDDKLDQIIRKGVRLGALEINENPFREVRNAV